MASTTAPLPYFSFAIPMPDEPLAPVGRRLVGQNVGTQVSRTRRSASCQPCASNQASWLGAKGEQRSTRNRCLPPKTGR
jgi:hypothetical protein